MTTPTVTRLAAFFEGLARNDAGRLQALADAAQMFHNGRLNDAENLWRSAAFRELQQRYAALVQGFDLDTLIDIAAGDLDARAVAKHVLGELRAKAAQPDDPASPPPWGAIDAGLRASLATVAHRFLRFSALESRHDEAWDFQRVGFADVRDALAYAYFMGFNARTNT
jgi:hypothetical protein